MTDLHSTDRAHTPLGKRGAFEGVARRHGRRRNPARMTPRSSLRPPTNQALHSPQRVVRKVDCSIKGSETPHSQAKAVDTAVESQPAASPRTYRSGRTSPPRQPHDFDSDSSLDGQLQPSQLGRISDRHPESDESPSKETISGVSSSSAGVEPDPEMTPPTLTAIRSRLNNTYSGYSIGCAAAWAALLAMGRGLLDAKNWDMLRIGAAGWWAGWLSATIARVGYPPPRKLTEAGQRRLEKVSLVLVVLGFVNFFRLLITGRRRAGGTAVGSV